MIGYYVHHHGRGHLSRATAIADRLDAPVVGLSSLPRPAEWRGGWVQLPRDDEAPALDTDANGRLHWAPLGHDGLRRRMAVIAKWIETWRPEVIVVDVSVEVALLVRLHGVPVVTVAMPGCRDDPAHVLGFEVSTAIIGAWPPEARGMLNGMPEEARRRVRAVGAISRFSPSARPASGIRSRHVVVLGGSGGDDFTPDAVAAARRETPGWDWTHLGRSGTWSERPWELLRSAEVVVTHAGESAIAEVAAARRPAIVIPQERPHAEQQMTAAVLSGQAWPALVRRAFPAAGWPRLLIAARDLDGTAWAAWNDGGGARRAAAAIADVISTRRAAA
jgi:hypothetical protein